MSVSVRRRYAATSDRAATPCVRFCVGVMLPPSAQHTTTPLAPNRPGLGAAATASSRKSELGSTGYVPWDWYRAFFRSLRGEPTPSSFLNSCTLTLPAGLESWKNSSGRTSRRTHPFFMSVAASVGSTDLRAASSLRYLNIWDQAGTLARHWGDVASSVLTDSAATRRGRITRTRVCSLPARRDAGERRGHRLPMGAAATGCRPGGIEGEAAAPKSPTVVALLPSIARDRCRSE
mmetsp:Transcript_14193/g.40234  ORF Transcript_14193/g.40234 Transcript_14193/m.40234 type:complete len:234 (-) Transcript_14193:83-784(-)